MKQVRIYSALALLALTACSGSGPKADSTLGSWQVMTTGNAQTALCYAGTGPVSSVTTLDKRDQPYLMATRRQSGKIEISASSGYAYKKGTKVQLIIDGKSHRLFFKGAVAWARNDDEDKDLIKALKTATNIQVLGTSQSGLTSVDNYASDGFEGAVVRLRKLCP